MFTSKKKKFTSVEPVFYVINNLRKQFEMLGEFCVHLSNV